MNEKSSAKMQKVLVIGCPGSGKSTFSAALHRLTGLPLVHLDNLYWNADRTTVAKDVFLARLDEAMRGESWIIDGNYASTMEMRLRACDTVFFLDYPTEVCLDGIRARQGKPRADLPWIEPVGEEDEEFLAFIRRFETESRPTVLALLQKYKEKTHIILKSRAESDAFLERYK